MSSRGPQRVAVPDVAVKNQRAAFGRRWKKVASWISVWVVSALGLAGCPEMSIEPAEGPQGAQQMVVELDGDNTTWGGSTTASFPSGSGIHIDDFEVHGNTSASLTITVPNDEPTGAQKLTVKTGDEEVSAEFAVTPGPQVTMSPTQGQRGQSGLLVTLQGLNTHFTGVFDVVVGIPNVKVMSSTALDDTTAEMVLDIDEAATAGDYPGAVVVHTDFQVLELDFGITEPLVRRIEVTPTQGEQSQDLTVGVKGVLTWFNTATMAEVTPGSGVDVLATRVFSAEDMEVDLRIHNTAAAGARTFAVTDATGPLYADFDVVADATPAEVEFVPSVVTRGEELWVEAQGTDTHFIQGETTVEVSPAGTGLTATVESVASQSSASLRLVAATDASLGTYAVTLHTLGEHVTGQVAVVAMPEDPVVFLHPDSGRQGDVVDVEVEGLNTHFSTDTDVVFPIGSGVEVVDLTVDSTGLAHATVEIAPDAPIQSMDVTVETPSESESVLAGFSVLAGLPFISLDPGWVSQGSEGVSIVATGSYLTFDATPSGPPVVEPSSGCGVEISTIVVEDPQTVSFEVTVGLTEPAGACPLVFATTDGPVSAELTIASGVETATIPSDTTATIDDGPIYFAVDLSQGEVFSARTTRRPWTFLDTVLEVAGPDGDFLDPLAENDDECEATTNSLVVYRAPSTGRYYLKISDRLGINSGELTLSLRHYAPQRAVENTTPNDTIQNAEIITERVVRGSFGTGDATDVYDVQAVTFPPTSSLVAVEVVAKAVSPFETSGADVVLRVYDAAETLVAEQSVGTYSADPVLYVDLSDVAYIEVGNEGGPQTGYWLTLRPAVIINEIHHDEATGWEAGFVELAGPPGHLLDGCQLVGRVKDTTETSDAFTIDLSGKALNPTGYLVIAHDSLVPGTGPENIDETLSLRDPEPPGAPYTSIGIFLECAGSVLDAYCYRGTDIDGCEGSAGNDKTATSMGRGHFIDRDENDVDFMEQLEPSPWARNLTEVAR
jgi:hypothetical protein